MGKFKDAKRHLLAAAVEFSGLIIQNSFKFQFRVPLAEDSEYRVKIDGMTLDLKSRWANNLKLYSKFGVQQIVTLNSLSSLQNAFLLKRPSI